ncbi:MAG: DUF6351 family protein, partial [Burkholderiaceae bacterium]
MRHWSDIRLYAVFAAALAMALPCGWAAADEREDDDRGEVRRGLSIRTLSNRADLISDGNALVEVHVPRQLRTDQVKVTLNGVNVTSSFVANATARTLRGVITGLRVGKNELSARASGRHHAAASLTLTNHARGGPVLLGSQTTPWICATP